MLDKRWRLRPPKRAEKKCGDQDERVFHNKFLPLLLEGSSVTFWTVSLTLVNGLPQVTESAPLKFYGLPKTTETGT
jgi:hypothetical protein